MVPDSVMVAGAGLAGALITQGVTWWKNRGDHELSALQATVSLLCNRVTHLEESLVKAEERADAEAAESREAERLLWHVTGYLREVLLWARSLVPMIQAEGIPTEPEVPDTIKPYL